MVHIQTFCLHPTSPTPLSGFRHIDHTHTVTLFLSGLLLSISSQGIDHLAWFQALVSVLVSFVKCQCHLSLLKKIPEMLAISYPGHTPQLILAEILAKISDIVISNSLTFGCYHTLCNMSHKNFWISYIHFPDCRERRDHSLMICSLPVSSALYGSYLVLSGCFSKGF